MHVYSVYIITLLHNIFQVYPHYNLAYFDAGWEPKTDVCELSECLPNDMNCSTQ